MSFREANDDQQQENRHSLTAVHFRSPLPGQCHARIPFCSPLAEERCAQILLRPPLPEGEGWSLPPRRRGVRAPQRPDRFEQDRTGPNSCTPQILRSDQPAPSKTNHPQPLLPRNTLAFRPFRPSEKFSANHIPPTARRAAPALLRTTRWQSGRIEPCRTQPNTAEQIPLSKAVQNCPKLTTLRRQSPAKHCRSCRSGLDEKSLTKHPKSEQSPSPEHRRPNRAWRRILRTRQTTRSGHDDHHQ